MKSQSDQATESDTWNGETKAVSAKKKLKEAE